MARTERTYWAILAVIVTFGWISQIQILALVLRGHSAGPHPWQGPGTGLFITMTFIATYLSRRRRLATPVADAASD